jgi:FixJ family two-component response regulator
MMGAVRAPALLIAVVDDEESVRKALRRLLRSAEMEADTFSSGQEFLDSVAVRKPDCLVLDYHMAGLTGLDVMSQIVKRGIRLPTIVITGHDQPGMEAKMLDAGATAYISKPVDARVLLSAITKAISLENMQSKS